MLCWLIVGEGVSSKDLYRHRNLDRGVLLLRESLAWFVGKSSICHIAYAFVSGYVETVGGTGAVKNKVSSNEAEECARRQTNTSRIFSDGGRFIRRLQ